jgi:integrase
MQYLTMIQVRAVLRKTYSISRRDWLMVLLAWTHGLRRGEIAALKLADVSEGFIRVARLKNSLPTVHPLRENKDFLFDEKVALKTWLEEREGSTDALFPSRRGDGPVNPNSVSNLLSFYMREAGIPKRLAHAHALKHSCCALQARAGVKIENIAQYVGHRDIKNTRIYLDVSDEEAAISAFKAFDSVGK